MSTPKILVIHCSATPPSMKIGVKEIDQWHRARGWAGCGYHAVIRRNGVVETGRPENKTPAAQRGYNRNSIAICLVGGVNARGKVVDNFTPAQMHALQVEVQQYRRKYDVVSIVGHRDLPGVNKSCPGFDVIDWVYRNLKLL